MARITPYVARGTYVGQDVAVKARKFVWVKVGQGAVDTFSDHEVSIAGRINVLGYDGKLQIRLKLTDEDPAAARGPCQLRLNSHLDENASYRATRDMLTVYAVLGGKPQNISILPCNNGQQTECKLFGHINETVHLEPS